MKTLQEIEKLAQEIHYDSQNQGLDSNGCFNQYQGYIKGYIQCQQDMTDKKYTEQDLHKVLELRKQWYSHTDKNVIRDFLKLKH